MLEEQLTATVTGSGGGWGLEGWAWGGGVLSTAHWAHGPCFL